jgi:hypothetical protein
LRLARLEARFLARHQQSAAIAGSLDPVTVGVSGLATQPASAGTVTAGSMTTGPGTGVVAPNTFVPILPIMTPSPITSPPHPVPQPTGPTPTPSNPTNPTSTGSLPANVSQPLQELYQQFQATSGDTFKVVGLNFLIVNGTNVGVQVHGNGTGDFNALVATLQSDGMQVVDTDATSQLVEGMLPIAQLPTVAVLPQTLSITPMYKPMVT